MKNLRSLLSITLLVGLVLAELLHNANSFQPEPARSQYQFELGGQTSVAGSFLSSDQFIDFDIPSNPGTVASDALRSAALFESSATETPYTANQTVGVSYFSPDGDLPFSDLMPPVASELAFAYQDGGRTWYEQADDVLIIFPDESIKSYNRLTGVRTTWLQDRLSYPPVTTPDAYTNYQKNYGAKIVAQTSSWVLMEFPTKKVVKVAKPKAASPVGGSVSHNLPSVLPGYSY